MTLTLTVVASADPVPPRTRQIRDGSFSLGRAPENDWMLVDPEKYLSKRHCVIAGRDGFWEITDLSTNGTFLNDDDAPIGRGNTQYLRDRDRLRLGGYEIALRIAETPRAALPIEAPAVTDSFSFAVQSDHTPRVEDAFRPPAPVVLLDDDWDLDEAAAPVAPVPVAVPALAPVSKPLEPPTVRPQPIQAPRPASEALAAFLRGAGLPDVHPATTVEELGGMFRALVRGLRETLIARAAIKDEFRIAQTVIRAHGNNPLKFSANDDDAMLALLGAGRRTDMAAADAVQEALNDIRMHELATMTAMQSAVCALLRELNPAKLRDEAGPGGLLPQQRKARAWDRFEAKHTRLTQGLSDDFDSPFGRAFARAYERAHRETSP
jgi:type VI secretion system protein ImpI/type VI secretion system protein